MSSFDRDPSVNVGGALRAFRIGGRDMTTKVSASEFWRATFTPLGAATVRLTWTTTSVTVDAWGAGADWLVERAPAMCGLADPGFHFDNAHPVVLASQRNHPGQRFGASGTLYHELVPAVLGQRVTAVEALQQWSQLCRRLGEPAPGPHPTLRLPPRPEVLAEQPAWWFHPLGIEAKRANALRSVATHAARLEEWATLPAATVNDKLQLLPGIGAWTAAMATGLALGDPDAVPVGDYHLPNLVAWTMTGRARGTDAQMLELLEPYRGQRGRVLRLLALTGRGAPKFGPRQRIQPNHRR